MSRPARGSSAFARSLHRSLALVPLLGFLLVVGCVDYIAAVCPGECDTPGYHRDTFCDCVPDQTPRNSAAPTIGLSVIIETEPAGRSCEVGGTEYWLANVDTRDVRVFIRKKRRHRTQSGWDAPSFRWYRVRGQSREFLGCSPQPDESGSIDIVNDWQILRIESVLDDGAALDADTVTAGIASVFSAGRAWDVAMTRGTCEVECNNPVSPYCMSIPAEQGDSGVLLDSIGEASAELERQTDPQPLAIYMRIFSVTEDPCSRGPVHVAGEYVYNEGKLCTLHAAFTLEGLRQSLDFTIDVPDSVLALRSTGDGHVSLAFDDDQSSPRLRLSDPALDDEWGGIVRSIEASRGRIVVETDKGCLGMKRVST